MWDRREPPGGLALGLDDAERLLDLHALADLRHAGVAMLLAAAAGPIRPHELDGEEEAIAGYRRVHRPGARNRRRLAIMAIMIATGLPLGGTAYAAGSGRLPDTLQRTAHSFFAGVGVPAPPSAGGRPSSAPSATPGPTRASAQLADQCRAWAAFRADPHATPVTGDDRRELALAAGGESDITDYCQQLLGSTPTATPTPTGKPGNPSPGNPDSTQNTTQNSRKPSHPVKPSHG